MSAGTQEMDFPRGGASEKSDKKPTSAVKRKSDLDFGDNKKSKRSSKSSEKFQKDLVSGVWDQRLKWNLCQPGLLALGCVRKVCDTELEMEIADGVICTLPVNQISSNLGQNLIARQTETSLDELYKPGQLLPCKVVEAGVDRGKFASRLPPKVTTDPSQVNSGLVVGSLQSSLCLIAAVLSREDKGFLMDIGLSSMRAFLPFSEIKNQQETMIEGQTLLCRITDVSTDRKLVKLSANLDSESLPTTKFHKSDLTPGIVLEAAIERVTINGIFVKLGPDVFGYINRHHLPYKFRSTTESLMGQSELTVVITYIQANTNLIGLTALPAVVNLHDLDTRVVFGQFGVGDIVEGKVEEITAKEAVYLNFSNDKKRPLLGFATRPQLQLGTETNSSELSEKYSIGSEHKCRILGFRLLDRLLLVSAKTDMLKHKIVSLQEASPGQKFKAEVETVKAGGIYVKICGSIRGFIPILHSADIPMSHPEKSIRKGQTFHCRVLYVDNSKSRLVLTRKRTLVDSNLAVIDDYDPSLIGQSAHGTVVHITESGALVTFYGNVRSWIGNKDLRQLGFDSAKSVFLVGQPVAVRIVSVDADAEKLQVALLSLPSPAETIEDSSCINLVCTCNVRSVDGDRGLNVALENGEKGYIAITHVSDDVISPFSLQNYKPDQKLTCVRLGEQSGVIQLTAKPMVVEWCKAGRLPTRFEQLETGKLVIGVIAQKHPEFGYFVELPGPTGITGLVPNSQLKGDETLKPGQTVIAGIQSVDMDRRRLALTFKQTSQIGARPIGVLSEKRGKVKVGLISDVLVTGAKDGMFVEVLFHQGTKGRIHVSELADHFVAGTNPFEEFITKYMDKKIRVKVIGFHRIKPEKKVKQEEDTKSVHKHVSKLRIAECTVRPSKLNETKTKLATVGFQRFYRNGEQPPVFITSITKHYIDVTITPEWRGRVPIIRISPDPDVIKRPNSTFSEGQVHYGRVLGCERKHKMLDLSFLSPSEVEAKTMKPCMARIIGKNARDCSDWSHEHQTALVSFELANGQAAVAGWTDLTDDFDKLDKTLEKLKKGQCVLVCPLKYDNKAGRWLVSTRKSLLNRSDDEIPDPLIYDTDHLQSGITYRGFVKMAKSSAGLFICLGPGVDGRAEFSKVTTKHVDSPMEMFTVGSLVTVNVQSVNNDKIELSLLPKDTNVEDQVPNPKCERRRRTSSTSSLNAVPVLKFEDVVKTVPKPEIQDSKPVEKEIEKTVKVVKKVKDEEKPIEIPEVVDEKVKESKETKEKTSDPGFDWAPADFSLENLMQIGMESDSKKRKSSNDTPKTESTKKRKKEKAVKENEETKDFQKELAVLNVESCSETADDFNRMLVGTPNSSQIWLRYMAFFLQSNDIERARMTGKRALKTIDYREEQEKFNIWIGLLNLENTYGNEESLRELFAEALKANDPLKIYKQMVKIYQSQKKNDAADQLFEEMLRKFRHEDIEIWLLAGQHYMNTNRPQMARELMQRALKSAPETKHVNLISRFAQMEFSISGGDSERGKTLFESLIGSYPKKNEVWSLYIDMTTKYSSTEEARALYERVTSLSLGAHKMRSFFKKWLDFEQKYGTEETQTYVKERALGYVKIIEEKIS